MPQTGLDLRDWRTQAAALLYRDGMSQIAIGRLLGMTTGPVSRLITQLRAAGCIHVEVNFAERLAASNVLALMLDSDLCGQLSQPALEVLVSGGGGHGREPPTGQLSSGGGDRNPAELQRLEQQRELVATLAAIRFVGWLRKWFQDGARRAVVGVSWGAHVGSFVTKVGELLEWGPSPERFEQVTVFTVNGDMISEAPNPQFFLHPEFSRTSLRPLHHPCSTNALRLAAALGTERLAIFPGAGWIPVHQNSSPDDVAEAAARADQHLRQYDAYTTILNDYQQADAVISGVGTAASYLSMLGTTGRHHPAVESIREAAEPRRLVGDLAGVMLRSDGPDEASPEARLISSSFLGFKLAHQQAIAARARQQPSRLGMMVLASSLDRLEPVQVAATHQLCNVLVLDRGSATRWAEQLAAG